MMRNYVKLGLSIVSSEFLQMAIFKYFKSDLESKIDQLELKVSQLANQFNSALWKPPFFQYY